jgi:hypothetical protein
LLLDELTSPWLGTRVLVLRSVLRISVPLVGGLCAWGVAQWEVRAAGGSVADQARSLIAEVGADASARELVNPATTRASDGLSRAAATQVPAHAELLEAAALEWAQVARDLKRARDAEQASDQLEQEVSSLQTELVRSRAAVEQAAARVGRARQELVEVQAASSPRAAPARGASEPAHSGAR